MYHGRKFTCLILSTVWALVDTSLKMNQNLLVLMKFIPKHYKNNLSLNIFTLFYLKEHYALIYFLFPDFIIPHTGKYGVKE